MKKYRLQKQSPWGIYGKFAVYFALWNYIGYKLYQKMSNSARKKYPNFDELTSSQKILTFFMNPSDEVHLVRIEGLTVKDKEIKRVEDIIRRNDKNVSSSVPHDPEEIKD